MSYFWKKRKIVGYYLSILVVLIHISTKFNYEYTSQEIAYNWYHVFDIIMRNTFTQVAVPLFLIISGTIFFRDYANEKFSLKIKNRIHSLLIPFLLWNVIATVFEIFVTHSPFSSFLVGRQAFEFSLSNILLSIVWYKTNSVFWFIFDLIVFCLISPALWFFLRKKSSAILTLIVIIVLNIAGIGLPDAVFFRSDALLYFFTGAVIGTHYFDWFMVKNAPSKIKLSIFVVIICIVFEAINKLKIIHISDGWNVLVLIPFSIATWVMADLFIDRMSVAPRYDNSFMMYALNQNVEAVVVKYFLSCCQRISGTPF